MKSHRRTQHLKQYRYQCERCGHGVEKMRYLNTHRCRLKPEGGGVEPDEDGDGGGVEQEGVGEEQEGVGEEQEGGGEEQKEGGEEQEGGGEEQEGVGEEQEEGGAEQTEVKLLAADAKRTATGRTAGRGEVDPPEEDDRGDFTTLKGTEVMTDLVPCVVKPEVNPSTLESHASDSHS